MTKEEAVARAIEQAEVGYSLRLTKLVDGVSTYALVFNDGAPPMEFDNNQDAYKHIADRKRMAAARLAIAAAAKWDAEQAKGRTAISGNSQSLGISSGAIGSFQPQPALNQDAMDAETARRGIKSSLALSPGLDSEIQEEINHGPKDIMEEGK
jgi:hypothetical protein